LTRIPCRRGEFLQFDLDILRAVGSPDDMAGIGFTVLPPAEPKKDYLTPEIYLDGEKIDHRSHFFNVPTTVPKKLVIKIYILPTAKWFTHFNMKVRIEKVGSPEAPSTPS